MAYTTLLSNSKKTKKFQINEDNKSAQFHLKYPQILINKNNVSITRIILCLATLELWLPDMYSFVVFLLPQKANLTIF
jgi:hypothetical protein